ncbi:GNAT family N-acetyltransferase [Robertmurraya korlensis]|uniref:GNAT family N-acetyltransferase n=1 Tax=Robertmurraya korlensis TaxID=519977 RepID=UPI00203CE8CF|nr:GNAT family N-acetyltransferase [Robertmurraya korlensis]
MIINNQEYQVHGLKYTIRSAFETDAETLSDLRLQIDGETEYMDRERGEGFINAEGFEQLIKSDSESAKNIFLVAVVDGRIVGYSRCEGSNLKRLAHKVEFGICVLKDFWGYGMGRNLLKESVAWADFNGVKKMNLHVLEINTKAIQLYEMFGFTVEGVLKNDKLLSDGKYYNTIVMGRWNSKN